MPGIDIASILANFVIASVVLYLSDRERKTLLDRLTTIEKRLEEEIKLHMDDLRDWSGIDPRFSTWGKSEDDTRTRKQGDTANREYMIDDRERAAAIKRMNE